MREKNYTESDWKLFRSRIADWQESYIGRLNAEYVQLLQSEGSEAEKFWALEERIRRDRRDAGVIVEMSRSLLVDNLFSLLREGAITFDDLDGFSDTIKDALEFLMRR